MTFHTASQSFSAHQEEASFDVSELFFSRTDERGVIQAGNEVFRRISGFEWDELINAPHKIIRHPDMPKGVFQILWERIQRGLSTGAYVKNKAKDGKHYWVFAIVTPIEGGYISVRLKPTSPVFETVKAAYAEALAKEQSEGLTPEQSAASIRAHLGTLGFPTYAAFSSYAIGHETIARDRSMGRTEDARIRSLKDLLPELKKIEADQRSLFAAFDAIRGIPSNMRIVASRLEPAGGPISAISQNYRLMASEVTDHLGAFMAADGKRNLSKSILSRVYQTLFIVAASRVQREVRKVAEGDLASGNEAEGFDEEVSALSVVLDHYTREAATMLADVYGDISRLAQSSKDLKQLVTGLNSIRVLCRVEAGRLGKNSSALTPVIDQLDRFHVDIEATLERILYRAETVKDLVEAAMPRSANGTVKAVSRA